jgi:pyruvate dehydrogenase E2 component (dihydrolipoamide acetyltransferase)
MLGVTVSCDHRVIDGALGAKLLGTLQRLLQDPVTILV